MFISYIPGLFHEKERQEKAWRPCHRCRQRGTGQAWFSVIESARRLHYLIAYHHCTTVPITDSGFHGCRVEQMCSGGWEWTSTPFMPFDGFEAMEDYKEYSTDFFDGKHFVLRGSSAATAPAMIHRQSFRNFYQRQYPYVFAKFRCCFNA